MTGKIVLNDNAMIRNCVLTGVDVEVVGKNCAIISNIFLPGKDSLCEVLRTKEFYRCNTCDMRFNCWTQKWI